MTSIVAASPRGRQRRLAHGRELIHQRKDCKTGSRLDGAPLPQLVDAGSYQPCEWDLKQDAEGRRYWVGLFLDHVDALLTAIATQYPHSDEQQRREFRDEYETEMRALLSEPDRFERIDILLLDELRTRAQLRFGFDDPFKDVKDFANSAALEKLPNVLAELDALPPDARAERLARGLLAGNMFDVGAAAAVEHYQACDSDFARLRESLPARPWFRDSLDGWVRKWLHQGGYRRAAFFVDNAGADICLGGLPLARWMVGRGARVTLVANRRPALNDVTAAELGAIVSAAGRIDATLADALASGRLRVADSGGWSPLIDLGVVSPDCVEAIHDADLIMLHGMGRAIESNLSARFSCDVLRTTVLKDRAVARWMGGDLFDCVFDLTRA